MLDETPTLAPDGQPYRLSTLRNSAGMVVTSMSWGVTLLSARIPFSDGSVRETLFGCASPECYQNQAAFLRASIGRCANRIANSRCTFDGGIVTLPPGRGINQSYGSPEGFDKRRWQIMGQNNRQMLFAPSSDDGDQGFSDNLGVAVQYHLTDGNRISIAYRATVDRPYPMNMTDHIYLNLDDEQSDVHNHKLQILAKEYLPVDEGGIPHDGLESVARTSFDFRNAKIITNEFLANDDQRKMKGYGHVFLLQVKGDDKEVAVHVQSADEKLQLKVYTTAPALQFYSGNLSGGTPSRETEPHADWQGLAPESELLLDGPNHPEWPQPDCFLRPDEEYSSLVEYQFVIQ